MRLGYLLLAFLAASPSFAAILVESTADIGYGGVVPARKNALGSALYDSVNVTARRYVGKEQYRKHEDKLLDLIKNPGDYVLRYAIESEEVSGLDPQKSIKIKVSVDVDEKRLASDIERIGLEVKTLKDRPRILLAGPKGKFDREKLESLAGDFDSVGMNARIFEEPVDPENMEKFTKLALADGRHLALIVALSQFESKAPAKPAEPVAKPTVGYVAASEPPKTETRTFTTSLSGGFYDLRTGKWLEKNSEEGTSTDADEAKARDGSLKAAKEGFFSSAVSQLSQSGWKLGEEEAELFVEVVGLDTPQLLEKIQASLEQISEVRGVSLVSLKPKAATWLIKAVNSGLEWPSVLGMAEPGEGKILWIADPKKESRPLTFRGKWSKE